MVTPTVTTKVNNSNYDVSADQWNALMAATKNQGYSYIIYKSGSTYYARNGATGAVDYSDATFKTVYDAASTVLTATQGTIVLQPDTTFVSTSGLSAYSNVNVISNGATLQVTSNTASVHGVTFSSVVNSVWEGVNIERVGVNAGSSYVVYVTGATDDTVVFRDCNITNLVTGTATHCYGFFSGESSSPVVTGCTVTGGSGGTNCHGFFSGVSSSPVVTGCTVTGGSGGIGCYGFFSGVSSSPVVSDCIITGGSGGAYCYGFNSGESSSPVVTGCTVTGGSGGTYCYGFYSAYSSSPVVSDCIITGGSGGTGCYGFVSVGSSSPTVTNNNITLQQFTLSWSYNSADNGRFQPFATHPYILRGIYVSVNVATAGVTLDLGTSIAGTEIATGIPINSTGAKYFGFTSPIEVAGDAYLYATPSGATANAAFSVYYVVSTNYASCYSLSISSIGYGGFSGNTIISNGASDAVYLSGSAVSSPYWKISNSHLESLDATNQYAVSASGALVDAPIYNCVLVHSLLNVTPDAGTAQGTNWQDPLVAKEETLPLKNDYLTKLLVLAGKEKLNSDSLFFTATALAPLIDVEGLVGKELDDALTANKDIEASNAVLVKEAKSLSSIVLERTGKTIEEIVPPDKKVVIPIYLDEVEQPIK